MTLSRMFPALALIASLVGTGCAATGQPRSSAPSSMAQAATGSPSPDASPIEQMASSLAPRPALAAAGPSQPVARPPLPTRLVIPSIQVDAPIEQVGNTPEGAMDVPKEVNDVGWYNLGFRPGERGKAVLAGHLDSTTDRAVFWDLNKLKVGDKLQVATEDGSQLSFAVVASETYAFDNAPMQKIFGPADGPGLNLVTCNGSFDQGSKNYD